MLLELSLVEPCRYEAWQSELRHIRTDSGWSAVRLTNLEFQRRKDSVFDGSFCNMVRETSFVPRRPG